ncbi:hypothetical protein MMIC_P1207 [Mariprofundus micogutta]|uniref:Antitoxin VbhA domain-containing protein n=2 Tax=Mariprofundus micogutta TaxID=1921010 RepID=A0A1L8CMX5_9PROT|nr:hypothetical protein MMIC_P1207 [Mariprofundus micogutta]
MKRSPVIDAEESRQRQNFADSHNRQQGISDPDILNDQQLYILGKMDMEEYEQYLLFKHSQAR